MRFSSTLIALVAPIFVSAAPTPFFAKRAAADVLVFRFADVLEQLESSFYSQAISKFQASDFTDAGFTASQIPIEQFTSIQQDEATHSSVLQAALKSFGETPITSCKFNFDSALTDVATMAATARVVENVGVMAYLGGAVLLTDPILLAAAGSILTVEARHQTILNVLSGTGTAIPSAFDVALAPNEVLAIASPFLDGPCDLGIPANPSLAVTNTGTVASGTTLTFSSAAINGSVPEDSLFCQMLVGGMPTSVVLPFNNCVVPDGINGPVALFITSDGQPLLNDVHDRAQNKVVAGPTIAFIDAQPQMLGQIVRGSAGGSGGQTTTSTQTISPAEASSIIADANVAAPTAAPSPTAVASSSDPASQSSSAGAPIANTGASPSVGVTSGPNTFTGKSPDGKVTVNGWSNT